MDTGVKEEKAVIITQNSVLIYSLTPSFTTPLQHTHTSNAPEDDMRALEGLRSL